MCFILSKVEVLVMEKNELSMGRRSTLSKGPAVMLFENLSGLDAHLCNGAPQRPPDSAARQNLASVIEQQHGSGRKSLSEYSLVDPNSVSGNVSLRKKYRNGEEYNMGRIAKSSEDESCPSQSQV